MHQRSLLVVAALVTLGFGFLATSPTLRAVSSFATSTDISYSVADKQPMSRSNSTTTTRQIPAAIPETVHSSVCQTAPRKEVKFLCSNDFLKMAQERLASGGHVDIVQIGAHVGYEPTDPIGFLGIFLEQLPQAVRRRFHWTFVEASPPNFKRLQQNLANHSYLCDMKGIHAGVIPDSINTTQQNMVFYSLSETIDPQTGYDSKSGKTLPSFITQVSGFSPKAIRDNRMVFKKAGLRPQDYIVETNVTTLSFSQAIHTSRPESPLLVLIDTEGYDCEIVLGISNHTAPENLPKFLLFESKQCRRLLPGALAHLKSLGYTFQSFRENAVGVRLQ